MARARMTDMGGDLSSLLGTTPEPTPPPAAAKRTAEAAPAQPKNAPAAATKPRASTAKTKASAAPQTTTPATKTPDVADDGPRYLTLVRKESRISQTQADQLSSLARSINMSRRGIGERITDNTLIRVAIGLLLERQEELSGTTEVELFQSLGLTPED